MAYHLRLRGVGTQDREYVTVPGASSSSIHSQARAVAADWGRRRGVGTVSCTVESDDLEVCSMQISSVSVQLSPETLGEAASLAGTDSRGLWTDAVFRLLRDGRLTVVDVYQAFIRENS